MGFDHDSAMRMAKKAENTRTGARYYRRNHWKYGRGPPTIKKPSPQQASLTGPVVKDGEELTEAQKGRAQRRG